MIMSPCVAQSLGEVARKERAKKKSSDVKRQVITEEQLRPTTANEATIAAPAKAGDAKEVKESAAAKGEKQAAAELQAKIKTRKQKVRELEAKVQKLQEQLDKRNSFGTLTVSQQVLIQPGGLGSTGPGWCALSEATTGNPYKEWCEEPVKLNAELEKTESELENERSVLETLQEQARRMGYGSAFYDPD
jgi:DNA repair exonuclease SbcCD ATPase subunit